MAIGDDFEIQLDKDIRYTGSTANYTVLEFHEWLRGLADDAAGSPDDFMDITVADPSSKQFDTIITLVNGFNIDDTAAQHLYAGSIIQNGGADIYDGFQVVGPAGNYVYAVQNGAVVSPNFWTTGLNADANAGISHQFMLKVRSAGADIDGRRIIWMTREFNYSYLEYLTNGSTRGVNVVPFTAWASDNFNQTSVGSMTSAPYTNVALDTAGYFAQDVNADSTDEYYYSEWDLNGASVANFYERAKYLTRRDETATLYGLQGQIFRGITHEITVDTGNGGTWVEPEAVSWTGGTGQLLAVDNTTAASTTKMYIQLLTGVAPTDGQTISGATATNDVNVTVTAQTVSTPFVGTSTGANIIGAYGLGIQATDIATADSLTALDGNPYSPPNYVTYSVGNLQSGETYVFVGPLGYRFQYDNEGGTPPFVVGEELTFSTPATADVAQVIDWGTYGEIITGPVKTGSLWADNDTISGGTSGATGDVNGTPVPDTNLRQFTVSGPVSGGAVTTITVNETIPADTPNAANGGGTIRIQRANGVYTRHAYDSWSGSVFTLSSSTDFSTNNIANGANCFLSYLDVLATGSSESFQGIYSTDRDFFIRARDGGGTPIRTYESTGQNSSTGGSASVVRTSDA
jgi:hypothetical protein